MPSLLPSGVIKVPLTPTEECLPGGRALVTLRPDFQTTPLESVLFNLAQIQPSSIDDIRGLYIENNHLDANGQSGEVSITIEESGFDLVVPFGSVLAVPLWMTAWGVLEISATPTNAGQGAGLPLIILTNFTVVPFYIAQVT
jgi:hypothetical protein